MSKLWLCGICQNNFHEIDELTYGVHELVDGLVWADHYSTDGTYELLNERRGQGKIIQIPFIKNHAWSMNAYLKNGAIKHGDWVLQIDTSERVHPDFIKKLKSVMLDNFEKQSINTVYQRSKPILFKYHDYQEFAGYVHWGIVNQMPAIVKINEFEGFQDDKTYLWSLRDNINKWIVNGIKYYLCYPLSNHLHLIYGRDGWDKISKQEKLRHQFREYCRSKLGINIDTINEITDLFGIKVQDEKMVEFINSEKIIANYYRYVQGEDQQKIYDTQGIWRYP